MSNGHLRLVGDDGSIPPHDDPGDWDVVIEELQTAHGMVVEAIAETKACEPTTAAIGLLAVLANIEAMLQSALVHAHRAQGEPT